MNVNFITPTKLSLIDIISMGDSSKRHDVKTIGQFDSGLKYAIALLLRNEVNIEIKVIDNNLTETFRFDTFIEICNSTQKQKELIGVTKIISQDNVELNSDYYKTGFAKQLGYNWELWMAFRELYSNMLDEQGYVEESISSDIKYGTIITLEFDETNPFYEIWVNKHLYINTSNPLFVLSSSIEVLNNDEKFIRIYKQNVLVYFDEKTPSIYAYNIKFGEIDERRILNNFYYVEHCIIDAICFTKNEDYLRSIINSEIEFDDDEFLYNGMTFQTCNDLINKVVNEVYDIHDGVKSYKWILEMVKKRPDCRIGGKVIQSIGSSLKNYSKEITIETEPLTLSYPLTTDNNSESSFSLEIKKLYNFNLDIEIKLAGLSGGRKVIADKYAKCLIIDNEFSIENETDMSAFIVEYIDLVSNGNIVENLGNYILKLLKR